MSRDAARVFEVQAPADRRSEQEKCVSITVDRSGAISMVRLEGEVDINSAMELKERLMEALAGGGEVKLDLSAASALDITAFQLIWAAERAAKKAEVAFSVTKLVPEQIVSMLIDAGLEPLPESAR
jgi:anti-anti-sigma factor